MRMTMEEKIKQLENQINKKGIGENSVSGGKANNKGVNNGVMKSGDAVDSGKGGGSVTGGNTLNVHTNNHIMTGGKAHNDGVNNGVIEGGGSTNFSLNNNQLSGGTATNELGSINHENSFIKGGNAIRELQEGISRYQGMQKQLIDANSEIIRKNNELAALQVTIEQQKQELKKQQKMFTDQSQISKDVQDKLHAVEAQKDKLTTDLIESKKEINQLRSDMAAQKEEIEKIRVQVEVGKKEIDNLETKLIKKEADKLKLEERLQIALEKNKKQEEKNLDIQNKIESKTKSLKMLNDKMEESNKLNQGMNAKVQRLNIELANLKEKIVIAEKKENESLNRISKLNDKITLLDTEKKHISEMLDTQKQSYETLSTEYQNYQQSVKADMDMLQQLKPMLNQIGDLAVRGEQLLSDPEIVTSTLSVNSQATTVSKSELPTGSISAGFAQNKGDNSGTIRGGDSISNSVVVNGFGIEGEEIESAVDSLVSSMSEFKQSVESIANETGKGITNMTESLYAGITQQAHPF
ncbi:hypothetical protein MASR2M36_18910 [Providencia sp.]